jgi:hypothetical protein
MKTYKAATLDEIMGIVVSGVETPFLADTPYGLVEVETPGDGQLLIKAVSRGTLASVRVQQKTSPPQTVAERREREKKRDGDKETDNETPTTGETSAA